MPRTRACDPVQAVQVGGDVVVAPRPHRPHVGHPVRWLQPRIAYMNADELSY